MTSRETSSSGVGVPAASAAAVDRRATTATRLAAVGSVLSAVLSSACCWLPLTLLAFGVSAAGVGAWFEEYRAVFLIGAAALLASGFYLSYFRKPTCAPDGSCSAPAPRMRRMNRAMLWTSAVFVAAFAFFPDYAGALIRGDDGTSASAIEAADGDVLDLDVTGMHCEACAPTLEQALLRVPGVLAASVDYEDGRARLRVEPGTGTEALLNTISEHGYQGAIR